MVASISLTFTPRQVEVVRLVARGFTNYEIGATLGMKERTARAHVAAIMMKLGINQRRKVADLFWQRTGIYPYPQHHELLVLR